MVDGLLHLTGLAGRGPAAVREAIVAGKLRRLCIYGDDVSIGNDIHQKQCVVVRILQLYLFSDDCHSIRPSCDRRYYFGS